MAILQSIDGRFYQVPDDVLAQHLVPADQVGELLKTAGAGAPAGQPQQAAQGQVQAYSHHEEHHGRHDGGIGIYFNYQNYSNYSNYANWGW